MRLLHASHFQHHGNRSKFHSTRNLEPKAWHRIYHKCGATLSGGRTCITSTRMNIMLRVLNMQTLHMLNTHQIVTAGTLHMAHPTFSLPLPSCQPPHSPHAIESHNLEALKCSYNKIHTQDLLGNPSPIIPKPHMLNALNTTTQNAALHTSQFPRELRGYSAEPQPISYPTTVNRPHRPHTRDT